MLYASPTSGVLDRPWNKIVNGGTSLSASSLYLKDPPASVKHLSPMRSQDVLSNVIAMLIIPSSTPNAALQISGPLASVSDVRVSLQVLTMHPVELRA